ncbi:hypothetical protein FKP32DRAFT_1672061 [Trametes sanguinea]|nr:hypothetical protein FKP32DRAFT_1672061 [Trametes sanguinea]
MAFNKLRFEKVLTPENIVVAMNAPSPPQESSAGPDVVGSKRRRHSPERSVTTNRAKRRRARRALSNEDSEVDHSPPQNQSDDGPFRFYIPPPSSSPPPPPPPQTSGATLSTLSARSPAQGSSSAAGPSSASLYLETHSSTVHSDPRPLPYPAPMLSNAPPSLHDLWSSTEGGELVVGQSGTNSFRSSPLPFNNVSTLSPPPSGIPASQSASGSNRASIANEAKPLKFKHNRVPASRTRSSMTTNNKSIPGLKRTGPPGGDALLSLKNNARHQGGPILPDGSYCWGSVEEHMFSHTATDAPLSLMANHSTVSGRYAAVTSNVAATRQAQLNPHALFDLSSPSPFDDTEYAPGTYQSSPLPYVSWSNLPHDDLADGAHASGTMPCIQITPPNQSLEGIGANEAVGQDSTPANPPHPAAPRSGGIINTGGVGNNQDNLTLEIAQQRTALPSTARGSHEVAGPWPEANTLESGEAGTEFVVAVEPFENISEADVWIEHWHEGIWGDDGYIYQLPPPILGYRPASRLHDLPWRGSQQLCLL